MIIKNIFDEAGAEALVSRIRQLQPDTTPVWGQMNAGQMLAHCSKPFETVYDPAYAQKYPRPNALIRFALRLFLKPIVVGTKPFKRNARTAPEFIVDDIRDFKKEQARLIEFIGKTQADGIAVFDGKESHSFGPLTADEWNMLFYKHTDHHLTQFGV